MMMDLKKESKLSAAHPLEGLALPVSKSNCVNRYSWGDDCYGWTLVDTPALSIKQELMPPGTSEKLHHHEHAGQFFFILKGRAKFVVDGIEHTLMPNEGLRINAGQKHKIANADNSDLEFVLYSQPSTNNDRIDG